MSLPGILKRYSRLALPLVAALTLALLGGCSRERATDETQLLLARQSYSANALTNGLAEILEWHATNDTGLAGQLAPGLEERAVKERLAAVDCHPTQELLTLWSTHNGSTGTTPFIWYHDLLSVDEAIEAYRWLTRTPFITWDDRYLPVFSFEGEWYGSYCGEPGLSAGPVLHFFLEDEPRVTHRNLTTLLAGNAEAMREGVVRWADGGMQDDIQALFNIHQKLNPGYPFPYHVPGKL